MIDCTLEASLYHDTPELLVTIDTDAFIETMTPATLAAWDAARVALNATGLAKARREAPEMFDDYTRGES